MRRLFLSLILSLGFAGTALAADLPAADPAEFAGKTIGVLTGSMQEQWAATEFPDAKLAYFSSAPDGVLALEAGKVDALFFSDVPLRYTIGERKDMEILAAGAETIPVAQIFGKNEKGDKLRAQFNEYLSGIKADGTLEKLEKKWVDGPEAVREFYDPTEPPNVNGKITVITQSDTAPFDYLKNGVMYGCEIELVREFCRKYGYQPVFSDANFDGAVMGVHAGKYDMGAAALMITEERAKSVNFGEPAFTCRGALLVRKGEFSGKVTASGTVSGIEYDEVSGLPMAKLSEFAGKRIGVQSGTTEEAIVTKIFKDPQVSYFNSLPDGILALSAGKLDAYITDDPMLRFAASQRNDMAVLSAGGEDILSAPVFQKTKRGDELRAQYNEFLKGYRESGKLEALRKKWIDGPEEVRVMDTSELPAKNGVVTIATEVGYAPMEYMKDGQIVGLEAELIREFCKAYGYRSEFANTAFDAIIMGVSTGMFDIGASGLNYTEERARSVNFGDTFLTCHSAILVKKDGGWTGLAGSASSSAPVEKTGETSVKLPPAVLSEFDGKRIGVQPGSISEAVASRYFKDHELFYFAALPDGVYALENDKIDTFMSDEPMLRYIASTRNDMAVLSVGEDIISQAPVFSKTEKGDKLRTEYNAFLAKCFENGTIARLEKKWIDGTEEGRVMEPCELPDINGTITIATEVAFAPMEYMKDGRISGFEVELIQEFCREYGYRPDFVNTAFESIIMGVSMERFDMGAACFTVTEERKKSVNFGDPFLMVHNAALVKKDAGWTGTAVSDVPAAPAGDNGTASEEGGFLSSVREGFHRTFIEEDRWKLFVSGMGITLLITVLSVVLGTAAGFGLYLLCRNGNKAANAVVSAVNWFITGMPLVVFLMVLFYIVFAKSGLSGTVVAVIGFTIVFALTTFHLMKSGEAAVNIGQKEAAYALGYNDLDAFLRIILPQSAMHFLPSYQAEVVSLVKATAVVGYITVMDVTKIGDIIRGRTYDAIFPLLAVVIAYFLLSAVLKAVVRFVIRKVDTKKRPQSEIMKGVEIR